MSTDWLGAKEGSELRDQSRASQPSWCSDDVSINYALVVGALDILTTGKRNLWLNCGIASHSALWHALGGKEKLRSVAHGSNGLTAGNEALHALNNVWVDTEILRSAAAWDVESVVVLGVDLIEADGHDEGVAWSLGVGLELWGEIVDGS